MLYPRAILKGRTLDKPLLRAKPHFLSWGARFVLPALQPWSKDWREHRGKQLVILHSCPPCSCRGQLLHSLLLFQSRPRPVPVSESVLISVSGWSSSGCGPDHLPGSCCSGLFLQGAESDSPVLLHHPLLSLSAGWCLAE